MFTNHLATISHELHGLEEALLSAVKYLTSINICLFCGYPTLLQSFGYLAFISCIG
jgi:hypothetical protein